MLLKGFSAPLRCADFLFFLLRKLNGIDSLALLGCLPLFGALPKAFAPASLLQSFSICLRPQASLGRPQMKNASSTLLKRRL